MDEVDIQSDFGSVDLEAPFGSMLDIDSLLGLAILDHDKGSRLKGSKETDIYQALMQVVPFFEESKRYAESSS